jgi:hypothetical protein
VERTSVGYSVNVVRDDIIQALKGIALRRLREQSPGLILDEVDWHARAEVFLPDGIDAVHVSLAKP